VTQRPTLDDQRTTINVLLYGDNGTCKTPSSACAARLGRVAFIDLERGLQRAALEPHGVPVANIEVIRETSHEGLVDVIRQIASELARDPEAFTAVVLDSVSELQRCLLEETAPGRDRPAQGDYQAITQQTRRICRGLRDLPVHAIFTAHVRRDEDADGEVHLGPALTPTAANDLLGLVDLAGYMRAAPRAGQDEPEYVSAFRPGRKFIAKDRFGLLPPRLVHPTFDRILSYVDSTYSIAEPDPEQAAYMARVHKPVKPTTTT
jgi:hypothetical protein